MARKARKTNLKTATHRQVANTTVQYAETKDFLGNPMFYVLFENGEATTMSAKRFNEMFVVA